MSKSKEAGGKTKVEKQSFFDKLQERVFHIRLK